MGGCFWIVQEEIVRHAAICELKRILIENEDLLNKKEERDIHYSMNIICTSLENVLPSNPPSYVRNKALKNKLFLLKNSFNVLIRKLVQSSFPKVNLKVITK